MKKIAIMLLAAMTFVACGSKTEGSKDKKDSLTLTLSAKLTVSDGQDDEKADAKDDVAEATASLKDLYNQHIALLTSDKKMTRESMSESLKTLLDKCEKKQEATDDLFFDYDYWINAQDFHNLKVTGVEYVGEDDGKLIFEVHINNMNEDTTVTIEMVKNAKGEWVIDNFADRANEVDLRQSAEEFMAN